MGPELDDFLRFCAVERRLAPATCRAYERDVRACLTFLQKDSLTALGDVRAPDLRRFLADEATRRPAPSSQARTVAALKGFFRFCVENEYLERDRRRCCARPRSARRCPTSWTAASCADCWP